MRWKFIIPFTIVLALIVAFNIVFLDAIIKRVIIAGGEKIALARVEVGGVRTTLKNLSVEISGLRVADKSDVWKNLFEVKSIRFSLKPVPLLSKKFIIEEMALEGLRWGTKRSTSGALPPRKVARLEKGNRRETEDGLTARLMEKIQERGKTELAALPALDTLKNAQDGLKNVSVESVANTLDLQTVREIETIRTDLTAKYGRYEQTIGTLDLQEKINQASSVIQQAREIKIQSIQDIEPAKAKIDQLGRTRDDLEKTVADIKSLKSQAARDLGEQKELLGRINELKDRDLKALQEKLQLPSFSYANVSQAIFGPVWISRVNGVIGYIHLARKYMPKRKKDEQKVVRTRMQGMDVSFPKKDNPPDFLIGRISLSGSTGGEGKEGTPLDFQGQVFDVTSDQALLGRPTRALIKGVQGGRALNLTAVFDHVQEVSTDSLLIEYTGMNVRDFGLPSSDYLPSFEDGDASLSARFALSGDTFDSSLSLLLNRLRSPASSQESDEIRKTLASLWSGISDVNVSAGLSGTPDDLKMSVSSNLDELLAARLKGLYGEKMTELQNRARAEIDRLTEQKKQELLQEFASRKDALLKQYGVQEKTLQDLLDTAKNRRAELENQLRSQADQEKKRLEEEVKKKAEDELKKKGQEMLKGIFK